MLNLSSPNGSRPPVYHVTTVHGLVQSIVRWPVRQIATEPVHLIGVAAVRQTAKTDPRQDSDGSAQGGPSQDKNITDCWRVGS